MQHGLNRTNSTRLLVAALLLAGSTFANAGPRLADGFQYPVGGSTPGSVTPGQDQVDDFFNELDFMAPGTGDTANALHSGEDWRRNESSTIDAPIVVRASAAGEIVAVSPDDRIVLLRHQVPAGTLATGTPSPRLAGAEELYTLYMNVTTNFTAFNSQTNPDIPSISINRGDILGIVSTFDAPALHFELRTIEPDFDTLYDNAVSAEGFYADSASLAAEGLIDPSDFIDGHRTIEFTPGPQLYIHDDNEGIAQVDVRSGNLVGLATLDTTLTDIAFAPSGELFGLDFELLYRVDLASGDLTEIGEHGIPGGNALVFAATGELYGAGNTSSNLFLIDPTTAESVSLGDTGLTSSGDLAFFEGDLYMSGSNGLAAPSDTLLRLTLEPEFMSTEVGPIGSVAVFGLATASDGRLYGTAGTQVLEIDPSTGAGTAVTDYAGQGLDASNGTSFFVEAGASQALLASAILPTSRSVLTGTTATAFVSVINASDRNATNCVLAPRSELNGVFEFQATDPVTNAPTGTRNTPVDIAAGDTATFIIFIQSDEARVASEFVLNVGCENTELASAVEGINTLLFSSTDAQVADVVALVATPGNTGVLTIDLTQGSGAFALASANVGAGDTVRVTLDTGAANDLPLQMNLCETDSSGLCISGAPSASVETSIAEGATPTFSIFVTSQEPVDFRPELNRVYIRFRDSSGEIRGSTSVAVRVD